MDLSWDDLRLFLSVARLGGLRAASASARLSPATLGRRITALERQVGRQLFERSLTGYALTRPGEELLHRAEEVEAAMRGVDRWQEGALGERTVRISAGAFLSQFLSAHIGELWRVDDGILLEFLTTFENLDITRRAADIDFRRERPVERGVARRRLGSVAYALYSGRQRINGVEAGLFVGVTGDASSQPMARWLDAHHGDRVGVRGNDLHAVLRLVASGAGLSVLPCFAGDSDERLIRLGAVIPELGHELWLVTHEEGRHDPAVRKVSQRAAALIQEHAALLAGDRPLPSRKVPASTTR